MKIYLAGGIAGCTPQQAKEWRNRMRSELVGITTIDPLRCEPAPSGERYQLNYDCPLFGTAKAIFSKNRYDVLRSDLVLAYMQHMSAGTVCEISWAYDANIPIILVTTDDSVRNHPLIACQAGWILDDLSQAVDLIWGLSDE